MDNDLLTILIGATPVLELRGSIPFAISVGIEPLRAYFLSVFGNLLPIIPLLLFLNKFSDFVMRRSEYARIFLVWLFERTRKQHTKKFEIWGSAALFFFTAIPLPLTGAWTACVAAFVFGVDFGKAVTFTSLGVLTAGGIVMVLTLGSMNFI